MRRILLAGSGYVGAELGHLLRHQGDQVWTLRRTPPLDDPYAIRGDLTRPESFSLPEGLDAVVFCAGLKKAEPADYEALFVRGLAGFIRILEAQSVQRLIFTSTTGVYHEVEGQWVDESTPTHPKRATAHYYHLAEQQVAASAIPHLIARLSGIYGPGRDRLIRQTASGEAQRYPGPPRYMNHIHLSDAAGAIAHLLALSDPAPAYIISDDEPAERNVVLQWIADQLQLPTPPMLNEPPPIRRGGNKRCSNRLLRQSGYAFRFPTFREGYADQIRSGVSIPSN
jgi:nucleoside-diphosphate-sugar epimerase